MFRIDRRTFSMLALGAGAGATVSPWRALAADAYPTRPIHLLVGFTPGSSSDITARIFAKGADASLGQQVVIENKPGAGGAIAAGLGARGADDGYTLYLQALSTLTYKITHPNAPFDIVKDFEPVALLATGAIVMVVDPKLKVNSVAEFTALCKSKPGQVLFGTVGPGSLPDLCGELYAQRAGVKLVQVTYPGSPQVVIDLIAGRVAMNFAIASSVLGQIAAGQVKALAIAADKRSDLLSNVPTMAEAGMPDFNTPLWFGLLAPKGTPRPIIDKLAAAAKAAMHAPDAVDALHKQGFVPEDLGPDQYGAYIKNEVTRWTAVAQAADLIKS
ncbi:MAG TPA: tripartite tricarboxylate transporter substrate binding protein [Xanthobacteraceae bacterium]|nr:tripartite tricarboxylate transporter substrate binding protein [Xanthobacteraceae bacterium]